VAGDGAALRLSFQLKDARGRTAVDTRGLALQPMLVYPDHAPLPAGLNSTTSPLPSCASVDVDPTSGVGECAVPVAEGLFPSGATVAASMQLQLQLG
jgi:hypothetical protein